MCHLWQSKDGPESELSTEEWQRVLVDLRDWLGPFFVNISGGEPLLRKDIFDIISFAEQRGLRTKISSNGMLLTPQVCDRLVESGLSFLSISLDSMHPDTHNDLRGVPGVHERAVEALRYLRGKNSQMVLGLAAIVMEQNYRQLPAFVDWATELGVDRILFQPIQPTFASPEAQDPGWYGKNEFWVQDAGAFSDTMQALVEMKRQGKPIWNSEGQLEGMAVYFRDPGLAINQGQCEVGYANFLIDPQGNVQFCYILEDVIGNVVQLRPQDVWVSSQAGAARGKIKKCRAVCVANCYRVRNLREQAELFRFFVKRQLIG